MKTHVLITLAFILNLTFLTIATANNYRYVYTIGAYDEAFAKHVTVTKLGPMAAADVPPTIPKSFLEKKTVVMLVARRFVPLDKPVAY